MSRQISNFQASMRALDTLGESGAQVSVEPFKGLKVTGRDTTISVATPIGGPPEVVINTPQGEGRLPENLARLFVRNVQALAEELVTEARESLSRDLEALHLRAGEILAMSGTRVGCTSGELRGYIERPGGPSAPGAVEWIQALRNRNGSGDVLKGRLNNVAFALEPDVNPWSGKPDLVLRGIRAHPVESGRFITETVWGEKAQQFFEVVKEAFKANRGINVALQRPG